MNKDWKYCPYCGYKLTYKIETDSNSEAVCKTSRLICKRPLNL